MEIFHIYTGATGRSRLEDIRVPFLEGTVPNPANLPLIKAVSAQFQRAVGEQSRDFHNPAQQQLVVVLSGRMEAVAGDGNAKINLAPGDLFVTADVTGQGHVIRSRADCRRLVIGLTDWEPTADAPELPAAPRVPPGEKMRGNQIVRISTGRDNRSHLQDLTGLFPAGDTGGDGPVIPVTGVQFRRSAQDSTMDWHHAPRRQLVVVLSGEMEIEVGDGSKRSLTAGDVLLAEDLTGQGHVTRSRGDRRSLTVALAEGALAAR